MCFPSLPVRGDRENASDSIHDAPVSEYLSYAELLHGEAGVTRWIRF